MHIVIFDESKNIRSADIGDEVGCVVAGSSPDCHVYLPDVRIAEEHFRFRRDEDRQWTLECCALAPDSPAAYTRLFINALEATEPVVIKHNDEIIIGRFRLNVFVDEVNASAPRSAIMEDASKIREYPLPAGAIVRKDTLGDVTLRGGAPASLTAFAFSIHECADLASLLSTAIDGVMLAFGARQVWLGVRRHGYGRLEFVETRLADGSTAADPPRLDTFQYRCAERGQLICCVQLGEAGVESAMCIPLVASRSVLGMLYVDNKAESTPYGEVDLDLFTMMGIIIAHQLELIVHDQIRLQEAIAAGELSFIRELQSKMDPTNVPQGDSLQLAVYCKPGRQSAGDIYDVMRMPNGLATFVCGHVAGAPTRAALAMAEVRAAFRMVGIHADPPHVLLRALNWMLYDAANPTTLCGVGLVMNPKTGAMQVASAGTFGAVIVDRRGSLRSLVQPSVPLVGSTREFAYSSTAGRLDDGETMVLYSPGCRTVTSTVGEPLGETRFQQSLCDCFGQPASEALDELLSDCEAYFKKGRQPDDITIMILHRE